jgi:hypothetical protein
MFEYHLVLFQTLLGIIEANENDNDGINEILHHFQQYQASSKDGEG